MTGQGASATPVVLVHGVPDTAALWSPLIAALPPDTPIHAPTLPGFGTAPPAGFDSHMDRYADWLIATVAALGQPVHIVGHDWGGLLTLRAAHLRPDLFASWAVCNASLYPGLKWHKLARLWQTPLKGELAMLAMRGKRARALLSKAGMPAALLDAELPAINRHMKRSILRLYRSAVPIGADWGADLSGLPARGLIMCGDSDPFVPHRVCQTLSDISGAPLIARPGGHWALFDAPGPFAVALQAHWNK